MKLLINYSVVVLGVLLLYTQCGGQGNLQQSENRIKQRLDEYFSYIKDNRYDKAAELCSESCQKLTPDRDGNSKKFLDILKHVRFDIEDVKIISPSYAGAIVKMYLDTPKYSGEEKYTIQMVFKNGDWFVNDMLPSQDLITTAITEDNISGAKKTDSR